MKPRNNIESKKRLRKLLQKLAPKVGAKFVIEPEWGIAAQMIYKNGVIRSIIGYLLDLNNTASTAISTDKDHAKFFMKKWGYPVAEGKTVFENSWAAEMHSNRKINYAISYAKSLGYPVIDKPNSKSQGWGVSLVWNKSELVFALKEIFKEDRVAIIEKYLPGRDYRVVVLDGEIISAHERLALSVVGDGKNSIFNLLKQKQNSPSFIRRGIDIDFKDHRMFLKLKRNKLSMKSILKKGEKFYLLDNANLSPGGEAVDAINQIHKEFSKIAINLTRDMGLRFCGVDIMVTKGDISKDPRNPKECEYYIIETNASPGLVGHYAKTRR
ncbi:MAG: cyanophycin synthetase [bacterium]